MNPNAPNFLKHVEGAALGITHVNENVLRPAQKQAIFPLLRAAAHLVSHPTRRKAVFPAEVFYSTALRYMSAHGCRFSPVSKCKECLSDWRGSATSFTPK